MNLGLREFMYLDSIHSMRHVPFSPLFPLRDAYRQGRFKATEAARAASYGIAISTPMVTSNSSKRRAIPNGRGYKSNHLRQFLAPDLLTQKLATKSTKLEAYPDLPAKPFYPPTNR